MQRCTNCGAPFEAGKRFCMNCGSILPQASEKIKTKKAYSAPIVSIAKDEEKPLKRDMVALVCAVLSIVLLFASFLWGAPLTLASGVTAVALTAKKRKSARGKRKKILTAGFVLGIIGTVLSALISALLVYMLVIYVTDPTLFRDYVNGEVAHSGLLI